MTEDIKEKAIEAAIETFLERLNFLGISGWREQLSLMIPVSTAIRDAIDAYEEALK